MHFLKIILRYRILLYFLGVFCVTQQGFSQASTTTGNEFYFNFLPSAASQLNAYVTSDVTTTGTITLIGTTYLQEFTVNANETLKLSIPNDFALNDPFEKRNKVLYLSTNSDVTLYINANGEGSGASMVLPIQALDKEYLVQSWSTPSQFSILSLEDATNIRIKFSNAVILNGQLKYSANEEILITLNRGENILFESETNLGGTSIQVVEDGNANCKKLAVFAGTQGVEVSGRNPLIILSNTFFNQLYTVRDWGKEFFVVLTENASRNDIVEVMASEDNTIVDITSIVQKKLNKGETFEFSANVDHYIKANKPVSVMQIGPNGIYMLILSPLKQTSNEIQFNISDNLKIPENYLSMVSTTENLEVRLDGKDISEDFVEFSLKPEYSYAVVPITAGTHRLESSSGVVAHAYGISDVDGLGHAIGGNLENFQIGLENLESDLPVGETCANSPIQFKASSDNETLTGLYTNFNWDMGDGVTLTGSDVTHSYTTPGNYIVTLFASKSLISCNDLSITRNITVIDAALDGISGPVLICPNVGNIEYQINGALPDYSYKWFVNGGSLVTDQGSSTEVSWRFTAILRQLKAISISPLGCVSDTVYLNVGYHTILEPITPIGDTAVCGSYDDLNYHVPNTTGSVYTWNIEGGAILSGQGTNDVRVEWDGPGTHKIWYSEKSTTISDLCEGTSDKLEVTIVSPLDMSVNVRNVSCHGAEDGEAEVIVIGGSGIYEISWDFGSKLSKIDGLTPGSYEVTVTDEVGCELNRLINITQPEELSGYVLTRDASCSADTGEAEVVVSGGTGVYTYFWDGIDGILAKTGLEGGDYSVRVQDESGCEIVLNYSILIPQPLVTTFELTEPCSGNDDGALRLIVHGGAEPYLYEWDLDPNNRSNQLLNIPSGEYRVRITDDNGCSIQLEGVLKNITPSLNMPNVFSPNDDGQNDMFEAVFNCSTSFSMNIYNRWGNMVFQTEEINKGWDGTYKGEKVPEGTYFYQAVYLIEVNAVFPRNR